MLLVDGSMFFAAFCVMWNVLEIHIVMLAWIPSYKTTAEQIYNQDARLGLSTEFSISQWMVSSAVYLKGEAYWTWEQIF